ncbi:MAG: hypothetical protein KGJ07_00520 [Patescibacteria group bacterium]|nr:hypothetical protein [Patescibacteria group bacterium]
MTLEIFFILSHHCKHHDQHEPNCKKCVWWSKAGKCQKRKPFDKDALFKQMVDFYLKKNYTLEQANDRAMRIVEREIARHGGFNK